MQGLCFPVFGSECEISSKDSYICTLGPTMVLIMLWEVGEFVQRIGDVEVHNPKYNVLIETILSRLMDLSGRGDRKIVRPWDSTWLQWNSVFDSKGLIHIRTHKDLDSICKSCTNSSQIKFWQQGGEVDTTSHPWQNCTLYISR